MRRFRSALLIPALAAVGAVVALPHSAPVAAGASSHAVAWCVEDPVGSGCLPVPCPSKLPFPCPQVALAPAAATEF
jgi:hypothetical protein